MKLIKQQSTSDCGLACLAMVLGYKSPRDLIPMLGRDPSTAKVRGIWDVEVLELLRVHNVGYEYTVCRIEDDDLRTALPDSEEMSRYLHHLKYSTFIVGVPSLNTQGHSHFVLVHKGEILDPSNGLVYIGGDSSLTPQCLIKIDSAYMVKNHA